MNIATLWDKCLKDIGGRLSDKQMKTWLYPLEVSLDNSTLSILAPNKFIKDMVETDYLQIIREAVVSQSADKVNEINLSLPDIKTPVVVEKNTHKPMQSTLNEDLSFNNFVEGKSNQLAKAACVSVVGNLGQYNPLYIYGGVGLGKTHLLHSIGNMLSKANKKVVYLHS